MCVCGAASVLTDQTREPRSAHSNAFRRSGYPESFTTTYSLLRSASSPRTAAPILHGTPQGQPGTRRALTATPRTRYACAKAISTDGHSRADRRNLNAVLTTRARLRQGLPLRSLRCYTAAAAAHRSLFAGRGILFVAGHWRAAPRRFTRRPCPATCTAVSTTLLGGLHSCRSRSSHLTPCSPQASRSDPILLCEVPRLEPLTVGYRPRTGTSTASASERSEELPSPTLGMADRRVWKARRPTTMSVKDAKHIVLVPMIMWGHTRPMCTLAACLVKLRNVIVTMFMSGAFAERVRAEIAKDFEPGEEQLLARITLVPLRQSNSPFDSASYEADFLDVWAQFMGGRPLGGCAVDGTPRVVDPSEKDRLSGAIVDVRRQTDVSTLVRALTGRARRCSAIRAFSELHGLKERLGMKVFTLFPAAASCRVAKDGVGYKPIVSARPLLSLPLLPPSPSPSPSPSMMAEAAYLSTHTDLSTRPSATLVTDKVDPDALVSTSTATRVEAGKTSGSPAADSESQPLTFIVNLSIQKHDDNAKHADEKRHDGPKSEPRPDGAGEPRKANEVDGSEVIAVGPPSLSVDPQGAGSPSPSAISDQAGSESRAMPNPINDAAVARGLEAAPPGPLAQTAEAPHTETEPQSLQDSTSDKPAIPHDPAGGPYIHDDIFEIDLSIFQTYNPALYSLACDSSSCRASTSTGLRFHSSCHRRVSLTTRD
ncbi:hypothetical protein NUW54_g8015 [Trametes sanguinea]|uniref:Uncharacterized protein n=1 Tax=Trametes sanguinea TaxID=158606 RepID=A0ACC1PGE9_9APHY|nr:hypothetical protein NUW54_g8015 [Trametes sanguinea]